MRVVSEIGTGMELEPTVDRNWNENRIEIETVTVSDWNGELDQKRAYFSYHRKLRKLAHKNMTNTSKNMSNINNPAAENPASRGVQSERVPAADVRGAARPPPASVRSPGSVRSDQNIVDARAQKRNTVSNYAASRNRGGSALVISDVDCLYRSRMHEGP
ncbi:hypothetical protein EVAR_50179_1 [Eumeta japonica]|uniref:Uncharacterized protein n=1 Tax=Eumeta variegata TaxID=151549 RepID=A0A4C1X0D8_EUMVA|nr:hypothetical protein EVAR_50179_1 [Eumeta japonica]